MLHTPETSLNKYLVDSRGTMIPGVLSFDDETAEVELIIFNQDNQPVMKGELDECGSIVYDLLTVKTRIPGAKVVDKQEYDKIRAE